MRFYYFLWERVTHWYAYTNVYIIVIDLRRLFRNLNISISLLMCQIVAVMLVRITIHSFSRPIWIFSFYQSRMIGWKPVLLDRHDASHALCVYYSCATAKNVQSCK